MEKKVRLIDANKLVRDLKGVRDVLIGQGDPFLANIIGRAIGCVEEQETIVPELSSAERQAIFRLGQMDMRESVAAMIRDMAQGTRGIVKSTLLTTADVTAEMEVTHDGAR